MHSDVIESLVKASLPALDQALVNYRSVAIGLGSAQQNLLLAEVERRIRQNREVLMRVIQLVTPTLDRVLFTISEVVLHGSDAGQTALNASSEVTDEVWFLTEAFYWNAFRALNIFWGQGIKVGEQRGLPGIGITANRNLGVCLVRNQLIEHPELVGGSLSLNPYGSGPAIGSWAVEEGAISITDEGLFVNAQEWISYVTRRLEVGTNALG